MISRDVISAMRSSAFFVNIARGSLVDEPALIDALREGRIKTPAPLRRTKLLLAEAKLDLFGERVHALSEICFLEGLRPLSSAQAPGPAKARYRKMKQSRMAGSPMLSAGQKLREPWAIQ